MPKPLSVGWTVTTGDKLISSEPCYVYCVCVSVTTSGDYVELYEGRDVTSGRKLLTLKALANRSVSFNFTEPIFCGGGLYINHSTTGTEVTIVWASTGHLGNET